MCLDWLTKAGLKVESDKIKLIFFRKLRERVEPPHFIHLLLSSHNTYYRIQATNTLRHLGFFFNAWLFWTHHINIMYCRAQPILKALQLLGNSIHKLDQARWRLAYNVICLPVLTYRCQLWFKGKANHPSQKTTNCPEQCSKTNLRDVSHNYNISIKTQISFP